MADRPDSEPLPAVPMPNSVPTGERFATSTESYACGMPDIPPPQWLKDAKPHD